MIYRQRPVQVEEPSQEEIRLANLSQSGEDVESLLSGGASINDLVMAGILEDDYNPEGLETTEEFIARREREEAENPTPEPEPHMLLTYDEVEAMIAKSTQLRESVRRSIQRHNQRDWVQG